MTITMYQADRNFVSPGNDRSVYSALCGDISGILDRGNKMAITMNGLTATVDTGQALVTGALVEISEPETIDIPANSTGKICLVVDLSQQNDVYGKAGDSDYAVTVNQVSLRAIIGNLVQDDLNNGGIIYEFPIADFVSQTNSVVVNQKMNHLGDTGWMDLPLANGAVFNSNQGFAKFRILNRSVYIAFKFVDCTKSQNKNTLFLIPTSLKPSTIAGENGRDFYAITSDTSGNISPLNIIVPCTESAISNIWCHWNTKLTNAVTSAAGNFDYPLD